MFSHLHARKKASKAGHEPFVDTESGFPLAPISSSKKGHHTPNHHHHSRLHHLWYSLTHIPRELQWATGTVWCFLLCGLFLGYLIVNHRHRTVIYHVLRDPVGHGRAAVAYGGRVGFRHHFYTGAPRYVTVVLPSVVRPDRRFQRLQGIQDTWGPAARAIYVVHNRTEFPSAAHAVWGASSNGDSTSSRPIDKYEYPQLLELPASISKDDGWDRLQYTMRTVYERVNPDFIFLVNDHTFVVPPHVCEYLMPHKSPSHTDLTAGRTLANAEHLVFNSGAAGTILSRHTLARLIHAWDTQDPNCLPPPTTTEQRQKWYQNNPGLVNAQCLASLGVLPVDTRDKSSAHRFHAFSLTRVVAGTTDAWYAQKHENVVGAVQWADQEYAVLQKGPDCCAADTVSFHYVENKEALALFAVREALLQHPHMPDNELQALVTTEWPHASVDIGGYSQGLPSRNDTTGWKALLATLRKISGRVTQRDC